MSFGDIAIACLYPLYFVEILVKDLMHDVPAAGIGKCLYLLSVVEITVGQNFEVITRIRQLLVPKRVAVIGQNHGVEAYVRRGRTDPFKNVPVSNSRRIVGWDDADRKVGR